MPLISLNNSSNPLRGTAAILEYARQRGFLDNSKKLSGQLQKLKEDAFLHMSNFLEACDLAALCKTSRGFSHYRSDQYTGRVDLVVQMLHHKSIKYDVTKLSIQNKNLLQQIGPSIPSLRIVDEVYEEELINRLMTYFPKLITLEVHLGHSRVVDAFMAKVVANPADANSEQIPFIAKLRELTLTYDSSKKMKTAILQALKAAKQLTTLVLDGKGWVGLSLTDFLDAIGTHPRLTSLTIRSLADITRENMETLAEQLPNLVDLTILVASPPEVGMHLVQHDENEDENAPPNLPDDVLEALSVLSQKRPELKLYILKN